MKCSVPLALAVLCPLAVALAGPEQIIKQRAKEQVQQSNVRQGVAPPTQATLPSAATPAAPAAPQMAVSLAYFSSGLAAIKAGSVPTAEQKQKLTQQLIAGAQAAKPGQAKAAKLVDDLAAAFVEKPLSSSSRARLVQELDAILNPGKYPQARAEGIYSDIQAIFQENGLARSKAVAISEAVKAIGTEILQGGAH